MNSNPPLHGVRILDLTRLLPGPMCTMHLADLGADVIKIEDTGAGDYAAQSVRSLVNRNKRGIALDLKQAEGVAALLRLCEQADVLVEGFRPGVMARLGLDYDRVAQRNPKIVYCSMTGYGQNGPYRDAPGHDINYAGLCGAAEQNGAPGAAPAMSNLPQADLLGGAMNGVMGILAALFDAARTGRGRHVDVAMADGLLAHAVIPMAAVNSHGHTQPVGSSKLTGSLPCYAIYATADGRHLAFGALEKKFWDTFCDLVERADLKPAHIPADAAQDRWVRSELQAMIGAHDLHWWSRKLEGSECCVTPILKLEEALEHPQFQARGMVLPMPESGAAARQIACPVKMSGFTFTVQQPAPTQGQHTDSVLAEAGFTEGELAALRSKGVTA